LEGLAIRLSSTSQRQRALDIGLEAVAILRRLAARWPETHGHWLSASLSNLATRYRELHRPAEGLEAAREAVGLLRQLVLERPAAFKAGLALALYVLGSVQLQAGDEGAALRSALESVAICRKELKDWPEKIRPQLARALLLQAVCCHLFGEVAHSRDLSREALDVIVPDLPRLSNAFDNLPLKIARMYVLYCNELRAPPDFAWLSNLGFNLKEVSS
jgi:hypothetical protein